MQNNLQTTADSRGLGGVKQAGKPSYRYIYIAFSNTSNSKSNVFVLFIVLSVYKFFLSLFVPRVKEGPLSVQSFYFYYDDLYRYSIWQDAGIRTRVAATAARCATNELHTPLMSYTHPCISYTHP